MKLKTLALLALAPCWWAGLESIRYTFATGFPWDALGVAQYRNLTLIQLACAQGTSACLTKRARRACG